MEMNDTTSEIKSVMPVGKEQAIWLPLWRLRVKSITLLSLTFKLPIPRCMMNSEIISVDCSILDTPYTNYEVTRMINKSNLNQAGLFFQFEFNFTNGIYHTIFHSFNGKFNYDNNYQTLNQCLEKAINLQQSLDQLVNDHNTLTPNELSFKLKFTMNTYDIETIKENFGTRSRQFETECDDLILWSNVYFPNMWMDPTCQYGETRALYHRCQNYWGSELYRNVTKEWLLECPWFKRLYDKNQNATIYEINYSTKNIFVGLNALMSYYEQIRIIIQDCVENNFGLICVPDTVLNLLFEYTSFDKICPIHRDTKNGKYVAVTKDNRFNNDYIGYDPKIHESKNCTQKSKNKINCSSLSNRMTLNKFASIHKYSINDNNTNKVTVYKPSIGLFYDTCNVDYAKNDYNILSNKWIHDYQFRDINITSDNQRNVNPISLQQQPWVAKWVYLRKTNYRQFGTWINGNSDRISTKQIWIINYQMYCNSMLFLNTKWKQNDYFQSGYYCTKRFTIESYHHECDDWYYSWDPEDYDEIQFLEKNVKTISANICQSKLLAAKKYTRKMNKKGKRRCKRTKKRKRKRKHKRKDKHAYVRRSRCRYQTLGDKRFKKKKAKKNGRILNKSARQLQTKINRSGQKFWTSYLIQVACDDFLNNQLSLCSHYN